MLKRYKFVVITVVLLLNFLIAQPSWANRPNFTQSEDYKQTVQALDQLLQAKANPDLSEDTPEVLQQKIGELQLQKYILESATEWAQCRNETGNMLAIYAHKAKKSNQPSSLYYLGDGQMTDDGWNCDGVYLPSGSKVAGLTVDDEQLNEPLVFKIVNGTQLAVKANPDTGAIEFNVPPAALLKAGAGSLEVPNLLQTDINTQIANAPVED